MTHQGLVHQDTLAPLRVRLLRIHVVSVHWMRIEEPEMKSQRFS